MGIWREVMGIRADTDSCITSRESSTFTPGTVGEGGNLTLIIGKTLYFNFCLALT